MTPSRWIVALAALACAPKAPPPTLAEQLAVLDHGVRPVLPSPRSQTYARTQATPRDPIVATMMQGHRWDTGLAGAATIIALDALQERGGLSRWELREALWAAGYPHPVDEARIWSVPAGSTPDGELLEWLAKVPATADVGLVRARHSNTDAWVGLHATPDVDLGVQPRKATTGMPLELPAIPGASYVVSDPSGALFDGSLDSAAKLLLTRAGEWLVLLLKDGKELSRFPIFVDVPLPEQPLFRQEEGPTSIGSDAEAQQHLQRLLSLARKAYGLEPWDATPLLDIATQNVAAGAELGASLAGVGLVSEQLVHWTCDDYSVEDCLDRWVWDPRRRKVLLDPGYDLAGVTVTLDPRGVHATVVVLDTP